MDLIIGFVMQNLVAQVNFVEFYRNFLFLEATSVGQHMANHVGDTWQCMASHVSQCMAKAYACKTHGTFEGYKWSYSYKQGGGRRKRKGGKEKRKGGKEKRNRGNNRKGKKKMEKETKGREEKEGVSLSEQTRTEKNPELCYKR